MAEDTDNIRENLRTLRMKARLSFEDLGFLTGLNGQTLANYERIARPNVPPLDKAAAMMRPFGLRACDLLLHPEQFDALAVEAIHREWPRLMKRLERRHAGGDDPGEEEDSADRSSVSEGRRRQEHAVDARRPQTTVAMPTS